MKYFASFPFWNSLLQRYTVPSKAIYTSGRSDFSTGALRNEHTGHSDKASPVLTVVVMTWPQPCGAPLGPLREGCSPSRNLRKLQELHMNNDSIFCKTYIKPLLTHCHPEWHAECSALLTVCTYSVLFIVGPAIGNTAKLLCVDIHCLEDASTCQRLKYNN